MNNILQIAKKDNVAVAIRPIDAGMVLKTVYGEIAAREDIPQGHKIALTSIPEGENVIKYGFPIGHAKEEIEPGSWVHTHNMATNLSGSEEYRYEPQENVRQDNAEGCFGECKAECAGQEAESAVFQGYLRSDGRAGVRNEIWIIPTVGCVNDVAKKLAQDNQDLVGKNVEGLYAFTHPFGCSQTGEDHKQTRRLLAALTKHPNAAAVLVLSLGCENLTHEQFVEELGEYDPRRVKFLTCQDVEDELAAGRSLLAECADYANTFKRETLPACKLVIGMKCGASDGLSGITANPVVGRFSDLLIAQGGSTVLTEVPEMFGAEGMLMNRCINREVFDKAVAMINGFKAYFMSHHEVVYENPSPGNKAGGITTLEDKSCGCVQKGGTAPIQDVIGYGGQVRSPGLHLLYGPGNDLVSSTALAAAGAQIILFTTGRGTPFGSPVPTVKIATNSRLAERKKTWIDFNAGTVAEEESLEQAGKRLLDYVLTVADGSKTCNEKHGYRDISIFKDGVVL